MKLFNKKKEINKDGIIGTNRYNLIKNHMCIMIGREVSFGIDGRDHHGTIITDYIDDKILERCYRVVDDNGEIFDKVKDSLVYRVKNDGTIYKEELSELPSLVHKFCDEVCIFECTNECPLKNFKEL